MNSTCELFEMASQRGKTLLVYKSFKFKQHNRKLASGETKWRCIKNGCRAYIHTVGGSTDRVITSKSEDHGHEAEEINVLQRQLLSSASKRKAEDDISEKPSKIIRKELGEQSANGSCLTTSDLHCVRKNIYYARRKLFPALPKSVSDVHAALRNLNPKTNRNEDFLLINDAVENLVIFSCHNNLKYLCDSSIVYMDGTFSYCTKFFKQLFTLHGYFNGHYIPLVFCLLKDKSQKTYELCFLKIKYLCNSYNIHFSPAEIVVDFEVSIHNAIYQVWGDIKITGCRFHLSQAWYRQIQKLGLTQDYRDKNSDIGKWLHYCFGLLFLKPEDVEDFYFFELYELKPQHDGLEKCSDYLLDYYLTNNSTFPPKIWADASAALNKTTNACESFHSHFNSSIYQSHPSLFIFVNVLISMQTEIYIKLNSITMPYKYKNIRSKKRHDFICNKIKDYENNRLSKLDYIKIVSHYYSNISA